MVRWCEIMGHIRYFHHLDFIRVGGCWIKKRVIDQVSARVTVVDLNYVER